MDPIFCCERIQPHKPTKTSDDPKFNAFRNAAMNNAVRFLCKSRKNSLPSTMSSGSESPRATTTTATTAWSSRSNSSSVHVSCTNNGATHFASDTSLLFSPSNPFFTHSFHLLHEDSTEDEDELADTPYLIQVIRRYDLANIEWVRYFTNSRSDTGGCRGGWMELESAKVGEEWHAGESFKNYGCKYHYRLFEINVFERDT